MGGNCITCCITQSCWWNLNTDPSFPSRCLSWLVHGEREASGILDGSPITCPTEYEKAKSLCFRKCLDTCFTLSVLGQHGAGLHITALLLTGNMSALSVSSACSSCSFALQVSPVLVWRKWGHCYSSRAPPESITGHCSRECLASVKPCQGGYKAFLKSSESISTFCPPATSNSNSSCFQANSKANEALVPGLGGAVMTFTCCSSEGLAGRSWSSQVSRLGNTGCLWVSPSIPKFCMHWRFYERAWR